MSDFSDGASVGFGIQQRILAKKMKELETQRYNDETAYNRNRDKTLDERWGKEFGASEAVRNFNRTDADRKYALSAEELAERKRANAEQERRERIAMTMAMGDKGMQTMSQFMQLGDLARMRKAQIAKMEAETKALQQGRLGAGGGYEEYGPDGTVIKRRVPLGAGAPPMAGASQEPLTPESQEVANSIAALQTQIGQNKVQMAQGDNRTGFLNLFSRQGEIDEANAKIAKLRALQGGGAQVQPGAQAAQPGQQPAPQSTPGGANMVRIRTPQGALKMIDQNMLPQALQQGATVAQ